VKLFWKSVLVWGLSLATLQAFETKIEVGAGLWNAKASGDLTYDGSGGTVNAQGDLGYKNENNFYTWADFRPVAISPFVPNLRLEYTTIAYNGRTKGSVSWGPFLYSADAPNRASAQEYDATLYYTFAELVSWASVDVGINVKFVTTRYTIDDSSFRYDETDKATVPQTQAAVDLAYDYYDEGSFTLYDLRLAGRYDFDALARYFKPSVALGYRIHRLWL